MDGIGDGGGGGWIVLVIGGERGWMVLVIGREGGWMVLVIVGKGRGRGLDGIGDRGERGGWYW